MSALSKGQNGPLPAGPVTVTVDLPAPADVSALLVTESGKVRSDADFVFFNQPNGPGVSLTNGALRIDGSLVPADIAQVRVAITLDDASSSFGGSALPSRGSPTVPETPCTTTPSTASAASRW